MNQTGILQTITAVTVGYREASFSTQPDGHLVIYLKMQNALIEMV